MELQHRVVLEYRVILGQLKSLAEDDKAVAPVFQRLETGWLTPGGEILQRIEDGEVSPQKILRQSRFLIRKWFNELSDQQKARWIDHLRLVRVDEEVQKILQLSQRRLQQLRKSAKRVSLKY